VEETRVRPEVEDCCSPSLPNDPADSVAVLLAEGGDAVVAVAAVAAAAAAAAAAAVVVTMPMNYQRLEQKTNVISVQRKSNAGR
jgi:hypothetical protein